MNTHTSFNRYESCYSALHSLSQCVLTDSQQADWFPPPHVFFNMRLFALFMQLHEECSAQGQSCDFVTDMVCSLLEGENLVLRHPDNGTRAPISKKSLFVSTKQIKDQLNRARAEIFQPFVNPKPRPPLHVQRKGLPIDAHREKLLDSIAQNPLTLVIGETGCGKSSRIPQMIFEVR